MSGLKRGASWSDDEDVDDDDDDLDDLDDLDGAAGGSGGATGASGGGDDGAGGAGGSGRRVKNPRKRNSTSTGRRKIDIGYIESKAKRHVSFSKRKAGLMKKARHSHPPLPFRGYELSTLTGTECLILVVSETGLVYTYATPHLRPIVELDRGREFIGLALKGELTEET
ncbi:SRF-TF-domain-containing protein, partial [Meredithblackwellia eburnea MCA 4105]